jgi:hypothetical protein
MSDERTKPKFGDLVENPLMGIEGLYLGDTGETWQYQPGNPYYPVQHEWYVWITNDGHYKSAAWEIGSVQKVYWQ